MKYWSRVFFMVFVCMWWSCFTQARQPGGLQLHIKVIDSFNNIPLDDVLCKISCGSEPAINSGISSYLGEVSIPLNSKPGCGLWQVSAVRKGYATNVIQVPAASKPAAGREMLLIYLTPLVKSQETATAVAGNISRDVDKLIYQVRTADFLKGARASDIINRAPLLSSNLSGEVLIKGRIKAEVFIEGKPVNSDILKNIPAETIKQVEIIENPGAAFSGDNTGGVINIILRKDASLSGGSITGSAGILRKQVMGNGNLIVSDKKLFWMLSSAVQSSRQKRLADINRFMTDGPDQFSQHTQTASEALYYNLQTELFYKPDSTRQLSGIFYMSNTGFNSRLNGTATVAKNGQVREHISSASLYKYNSRVFSATAEYRKQLNRTTLLAFTGGGQLTPRLTQIDNDELSTPGRNRAGNRLFDTVNARNIFVQAVLSVKNKRQKIYEREAGILYRNGHAINPYRQLIKEPGNNYSIFPGNTHEIAFTKKIWAIYGTGKFSMLKKYTVAAGLRVEYAGLRLADGEAGNTNRAFLGILPNISVMRGLGNGYNLQLTYSRKTRRPDITVLSGFVYGSNRAQANTGNPCLVPEMINKAAFSVSRFNKGKYYDVSVYNTIKQNAFFEATVLATTDSSIVRAVNNFRLSAATGISASLLLPLGKSVTVNGSAYGELFRLSGYTPLTQKHTGIICGINGNLNWSVTEKTTAGVYFNYTNYNFDYQQTTFTKPMLSLSLQKLMLKDRVFITLTWMDVLQTGFNQRKEYRDDFIEQSAVEKGLNNNILIGLTYNFGKRLRNTNKQKAILAEDIKERAPGS